MAKWGEGDPRWLVEERPDATNPNNWHWVEKNATGWSKERLTDLFIGRSVETGPVKINFTEFDKLEGEATTNNRKAKLIFLFEWQLHVKFSARIAGSDVEYKGLMEVPNLSDENEADEIDISVTVETKGPHEADVRRVLSTTGLKFTREQCAIYIRELKEEFSKGLILPTDKTKPQVVSGKGKTTIINKQAFQNAVITDTKSADKSATKTVSSVKKLSLTETFKAPPDRLYDILTSGEMVKAWGGGGATSDPQVGGTFSFVGGQISGSYTELQPAQKVAAKWRLKKYPDSHFANVVFLFKDQNDSTSLCVEATDIPEEHLADTQLGFQRYYFKNMIHAFGIGLDLF